MGEIINKKNPIAITRETRRPRIPRGRGVSARAYNDETEGMAW